MLLQHLLYPAFMKIDEKWSIGDVANFFRKEDEIWILGRHLPYAYISV